MRTPSQMDQWHWLETQPCTGVLARHHRHSISMIYTRRARDLFRRCEWFVCWYCDLREPA